MNPRRKWMTVGAVTALGLTGVIGGTAHALNDTDPRDGGAAITLTSAVAAPAAVPVAQFVDDSPESADSPNASATDSAESPNDSPDDPGYVAPAPRVAKAAVVDSADSPVPAPRAAKPVAVDSPDSPDSPNSPDSPDSPDSPNSADSAD